MVITDLSYHVNSAIRRSFRLKTIPVIKIRLDDIDILVCFRRGSKVIVELCKRIKNLLIENHSFIVE